MERRAFADIDLTQLFMKLALNNPDPMKFISFDSLNFLDHGGIIFEAANLIVGWQMTVGALNDIIICQFFATVPQQTLD